MHSICTVYAQYMYSICTVYVKYMYSICTVHVQYMYSICTVYVQYMYSTCTVYAQYMYSICTVNIQYMYSKCTVNVQCMYSKCTVNVQYMYSICTHKCTPHRLAVRVILYIRKQCAGHVPESTHFLCDKPVARGDTICTSKHMTPGYCRLTVRREHNVNVSSVQMSYFLCRRLRHHLRQVFLVWLHRASYLSRDVRADVAVYTTELVVRGEDKG